MNRTRNFTSVKLVLLALLATVASAGALCAEGYEGTFTLPFEARWGTVTLPPGDYSFTVNTVGSNVATIRGENGGAFVMHATIGENEFAGRSALFLVRHGRTGTVRALHLKTSGRGNRGLVFFYSPPKGEPPMLAQVPELIQRIPILVAEK